MASLELAASRIEYTEARVVLVCGGRVPQPKAHPDAPEPPLGSLRHAIARAHTSFELFRPEEISDWHSDGVFKDLVSFERELANICALVVIIIESAGAMVELGAFSQLPELAEKSVTICSSSFTNDESFINLGILRFLEQKDSFRVKRYPWEVLDPASITVEIVDDVIADIESELSRLPESSMFRFEDGESCTVLISELIRLFGALKEGEIFGYLNICGFCISNDQLRGKLFLLQRFRIIRVEKYSDATFYVPDVEPFHKLRLVPKEKSKPIDALRVRADCIEFYKGDNKYKNWHRAIMQASRTPRK